MGLNRDLVKRAFLGAQGLGQLGDLASRYGKQLYDGWQAMQGAPGQGGPAEAGAEPQPAPKPQQGLAMMQPPKAQAPQAPKPVNPTAPQAPPGGVNGPANPAAKATGAAPSGSGAPGPMSGLQPKAAGLNPVLVKMALAKAAQGK